MTDTLVRTGTVYVARSAAITGAPPRPAPRPHRRGRHHISPVRVAAPWVALAAALVLWLVSLPGLRDAPVSQYGLIAAGPVTYPAALLAVLIAFVLAVRFRNTVAAVTVTVGLVAVERLTTSLITEVAPYSWTYKHIGVADYIQDHGSLARGVDIYSGWPGLFAVTAHFSEVTGLSPIAVAHWFTTGVHLAIVGLVIVAARSWGLDRLPAVTAAFLVEATNWVAQDYFAPQAVAFILMLGFFAVAGRFRSRPSPLSVGAALVLFAAIVVTHQLTPYWVMLATGLLIVTRRLRPWWILLPMAALAGIWLLLNWEMASHFLFFSADPISNAKSNIPTVGVLGQQVTSLVMRSLSVSYLMLAGVCAVAGRSKHRPILAPCILAFSPILILGGQNYGGEAIFRVFLYSLLGCALLVATPLTEALQARLFRAGAVVILLAWLVGASAQGYFGGWSANLMTRQQVDFADDLLTNVPFPSYVTVAAPVWPERVNGRYAQFARFKRDYDSPMIYSANLVGSNFDTEASYATFMKLIAGRTGGHNYLIISEQMRVYDWYFGILPPRALDNLEKRMRRDPRWTVVHDDHKVIVFRAREFTPRRNLVHWP
ncbi:hypothetical protein [Couchioplanes azureus]|uniref:hypothetical protein n=1 Tax=Couchioplanes caeruleus TaxID=56438 RepID=UPI001670B871|nr:hypothetical protein [Couchioplanes caeruleus]GGQ40423.1 hypothetical protein GCM10010166_04390 [Couchioplanes caeruleus subsp. azureus]